MQNITRNRDQFVVDPIRNIPEPMHPTFGDRPETARGTTPNANEPLDNEPNANEPLLKNRRSIENFIFDWRLEGIVIQFINSK